MSAHILSRRPGRAMPVALFVAQLALLVLLPATDAHAQPDAHAELPHLHAPADESCPPRHGHECQICRVARTPFAPASPADPPPAVAPAAAAFAAPLSDGPARAPRPAPVGSRAPPAP